MTGLQTTHGCRGRIAVILQRTADERRLVSAPPPVLFACWSELTLITLPNVSSLLVSYTALSGIATPNQVLADAEHDAERCAMRVVAALPPTLPTRHKVHAGWHSPQLRGELARDFDAVLFASRPRWGIKRWRLLRALRRSGIEIMWGTPARSHRRGGLDAVVEPPAA